MAATPDEPKPTTPATPPAKKTPADLAPPKSPDADHGAGGDPLIEGP